MPENACVVNFTCPTCQTNLKPAPGDCCVFCTFGDTPCPSVQTSTK
ncbi:MAG: GDCCVxC domain-containing (seleno)protein [Leptospirales bacterium]